MGLSTLACICPSSNSGESSQIIFNDSLGSQLVKTIWWNWDNLCTFHKETKGQPKGPCPSLEPQVIRPQTEKNHTELRLEKMGPQEIKRVYYCVY